MAETPWRGEFRILKCLPHALECALRVAFRIPDHAEAPDLFLEMRRPPKALQERGELVVAPAALHLNAFDAKMPQHRSDEDLRVPPFHHELFGALDPARRAHQRTSISVFSAIASDSAS